ncbi:MAG: methyltransferase [Deltaproteobacteria bacterium]|nr:methyltransferase [Deltaproteobacteria bacterium]
MRHHEAGVRVATRDDPRAVERLRASVRDLFGLKWWPAFEAAARDHAWLRPGAILPSETEIARVVDKTLPKETALFRHAAHWPAIRATGAKNVWSAGCATGEEAFSIALVLPGARILATDVAATAIRVAEEGVVRRQQLEKLSPAERRLFKSDGPIAAEVLSRIEFRVHNLVRDDYATGFDLIVCRNVLVYMEPDHKLRVVEQFVGALAPSGLLLLGSVDRIPIDDVGLKRDERNGVVFLRRP